MVLTPPAGPLGGDRDALAAELLLAVDEGRPAGDLCRALALAVLATEPPGAAAWTAAVEVLEGGAVRVRRAVLLAGVILDRADTLSQRALPQSDNGLCVVTVSRTHLMGLFSSAEARDNGRDKP